MTDLGYGLRLLRRRPGAAALVVATLAIGIAATTIVFSLADAILWRPLPFPSADRLVRVRITFRAAPPPLAESLNPEASLFDGVYPFQLNSGIVKIGGEATAVTIGEISPGLLRVLDAAPIRGREFTPEEYTPGTGAVIVSAGLWRRQQSAAASPDDRTLTIEGIRHTIVGVMADGFEFPVSRVALWRPFVPESTARRMTALGRLKPGVTIGQAQAFAQTVQTTANASMSEIRITPFVAVVPSTITALRVLLGAVALLLLVAVANAANIVQAETIRRETELAVRGSLGATWPRLVRQLFAETLLVSVIAAIAAVAISAWTLTALVKSVPYLMSFQALRPIAMDWTALLFATGTAIAAGIGASWLSAVRARRIDPQLALRGQTSGIAGQARTRAMLTSAQIAVTLVLLTGAGLLGNGFLRLSRVDPGFDPAPLVVINVQLPAWRYAGEPQLRAALERLRAEALTIRDVADATIAHSLPPSLGTRPLAGLATEDVTLSSSAGSVSTGLVDETFFTTLGIPLLAGRRFDDRDAPERAPVAIVSRALAQRLWPDGDPLGRRFRESADVPWRTVVGVVADVKNGSFDQDVGPLAYYTARKQSPTWWFENLIVRARTEPGRLVAPLRAVVQRELPDAPILSVRTGHETVAGASSRVRFATLLIVTFAGIALTVALIGIYGTFWCMVTQRTREIGVRMALGATPSDVVRLVLAGGARVLVAGLAVGLPLSLAATRSLKSLLFGVSPHDPATIAAVLALLAAAAMGATYFPARRAATIDPIDALRTQ